MTNYESKIIEIVIKYIYKNIIENIVEFYKNIKKLIKIIIKLQSMCKYDYYNFLSKIKIEILKDCVDIKNKIKKIFVFLIYFLNKYILNYSFIDLCKYYVYRLDCTNLKLHLYNKLDIYINSIDYIKIIENFIKQFIIYLIDKYYNGLSKFHLYFKRILDINFITFKENFEKLERLSDLKDIKIPNIKEEINFLVTVVKSKFNENHILLNHVNDSYYVIFVEE